MMNVSRREFVAGAAAFSLLPSMAADGSVMKTPLMLDTLRGATEFGPGSRTVFFVKGCPLKCTWCNYPESLDPAKRMVRFANLCPRSQGGKCPVGKCTGNERTCPAKALKLYGKPMTMEDILVLAKEDRSLYAKTGGGVTLSGGEPLFFPEWTLEFLKRFKRAGIHTCLDTSLYASPDVIKSLLPYVDLWLPDYKVHDDALHVKCTGVSNGQIRENLKLLVSSKAKLEVRCLALPTSDIPAKDLPARHAYLRSIGIPADRIRDLRYTDDARTKYKALGMKDTLPVIRWR